MKNLLLHGCISLALISLVSCGESEGTGSIEDLKRQQQGIQSNSSSYADSIQKLGQRIDDLAANREMQRERIDFLTNKKDSILRQLRQIEASLDQINTQKIEPGISGVNAKLDELKGQKENLQEQYDLEKQEIDLAQKKIELLGEEKKVYDAQRQALYDKGAEPFAFKTVDSLLSDINDKMAQQSAKIKNLNRNSSDILEEISKIDLQRKSLSDKIRNNYTAQQIFDDYSKEEKVRLDEQLKSVEEELGTLLAGEYELNNEITRQTNERNYLQGQENTSLAMAKEAEENRLSQLAEAERKREKKKNRMTFAFIGIGVAALLLGALYIAGKLRKSRKSNT